MENNINANINSTDCIKSTTKLGETIYRNICSNETDTVPWGGGDWFLFGGLLLLPLLFLLFILSLIKMIFE